MSDTTTATEPRFPHIDVQLTGEDGNAFAVLGAVKRQMRRDPEARDHVDEFMAEAMSGDYSHLLRTAMEWVNVS